jgi:putative membrane protein
MKPSQLIGAPERARIEEAVRRAEENTSGEIVVTIVRASDPHPAAGWRLGVALATLALFASFYLPVEGLVFEIFALQLAALVSGHLLCRIDAIRRLFLTDVELQQRAERAAFHAFQEQGLRRTSGRTGILLFVALLEHRVVVLADEAIDQALEPGESWDEIVALILEGIRAGRITEGIERAVARCGEILSHPLPVQPDDEDEIPHALVLSD